MQYKLSARSKPSKNDEGASTFCTPLSSRFGRHLFSSVWRVAARWGKHINEFPADAPIDHILERLMELGMDR